MGYLSRGVLAKSNGELVDKVVQMAKLLVEKSQLRQMREGF